MTTLYDLIDRWTIEPWNQGLVDQTLNQVAAPFHKEKLIFFLLEEIWDLIELMEDPLEFMTDARKVTHLETLLSDELVERAAKAVEVEVVESPELRITVLNAHEIIEEYPEWFEESEAMTWDDVEATIKKALDERGDP